MSINWKLMSDLRERQRTLASESVAKERKAVAESESQANEAKQRLIQAQNNKAALWSETRAAFNGGVGSIESLMLASAWSRTLDNKVAQAAQGVQQAQTVVDERTAVLQTRLQALRAANADVEKAKEMQTRLATGRRKEAEARADEGTDEWATYRWAQQEEEAGQPPARGSQ